MVARPKLSIVAFLGAGLLVALAIGVFVSPFASSSPDGLEKVSIDEGFADTAEEHDLSASPVADYGVDGVTNQRAATGLAGLIGIGVTFAVGLGVFTGVRALRLRTARPG